MTQANARQNQGKQGLLEDIIQLIASSPDTDELITALLHIAVEETGAVGAAFILFDEPDMIVSVGQGAMWQENQLDVLKPIIAQLQSGIHSDVTLPQILQPTIPFWIVSPIHHQKPAIGSFWLFWLQNPSLENDALNFLDALVASLKIIAMNVRARALFQKLNRNQNEFMRIVSHDLRSPLTSMQGFASMLELGLVGDLNEKQKHFVSKILAGITQMTALVDNIQDAGRYDPETGFYDMSRSPCDLSEMIRKIVENHLVPAEKALSISLTIGDDVPVINADANMLERAVINLFDNAIKYTPNGGEVEVGAKRAENEALIFVRDTGLGISHDAQQHLFERHVRIAREEHKRIKGSGLGLFIVRSVAQRHGGDAWVESTEGAGSTFFLSIPLEGPNLIASRE